ncbi:16S rRNA (cytidine(1402)-2'-O)-methyltransferase [Virgibacillus ndiopensis]|uniref:16S rRNA (cytidine(1402)-2'-O)-methyltransferase n=1 Tax=Virgibacillus ndiopensis TaxID=2004408 RepID=UPI000C07E714|nr:16S rRNA (cytidine(1402)-2'-O)-methyltransferase [Virgibacillus ndiopensis]
MNIQKSFEQHANGTIYVVPTPIGNLEDITYRALNTLHTVAVIAAEDTRNTKKLLNHFEINTPLISYHEHNKEVREQQLLTRLENAESIAIVSDAGMPGISDPGYELIKTAVEADVPVVVLPGANAALCALVGSGLPSTEFLFYGFLPRKKKDKLAELERVGSYKASLLFYESPFRVKETILAIHEQLGNRKLAIARELTKRYEEYVRGTASEIIMWIEENELKGEFCLVVEGSNESEESADMLWWSHLSVIDHVTHYMEQENMSSKDAIKSVAQDRKMPKREVYQTYHIEN